jgi:hypothetical protein
MDWEHFEVREAGLVTVITRKSLVQWPVESGIVTTGRQRVFSRYFVRIKLPSGELATGADRAGPVQALRNLAAQLCRLPFRGPLSSAKGARPASAAACLSEMLPSSAMVTMSVLAMTGPMAGIEIRMA